MTPDVVPQPSKQSLWDRIVDPVWTRLEPFLDTKFDELTDKVLALLPLLAAAAGTAAADRLLGEGRKVVDGVLKSDPDIPVLSDVFDLSEAIRSVVNGGTPAGVHIPGLDELANLFNRQPGVQK